MGWWDLKNLQTKEVEAKKGETKREYLARIKYDKIVTSRASSFKDIAGGELEENVQYRLVTDMSFNAVTVIQYVFELYEIEEIYIVVFRMNNKSFDFLRKIIEENNIKSSFIVSTFFSENKKYERWAKELKIISENLENVRVSFHNSHAKVFLCKTKCGKHIVFEGSGNLTHNERIEQYIFEDNQQVYNFHKEWIEHILNE